MLQARAVREEVKERAILKSSDITAALPNRSQICTIMAVPVTAANTKVIMLERPPLATI